MKFKKGYLTTDKGYPEDDLGVAMDKQSKERCCGPDCCDGIYRWRDLGANANSAQYISYVKNGVLLTVTLAVYEADKANGFV